MNDFEGFSIGAFELVGVVQGSRNISTDLQDQAKGERDPRSHGTLRERFEIVSDDVLEDDVGATLVFAEIFEANNIRVVQKTRQASFIVEVLHHLRIVRKVLMDLFDHRLPLEATGPPLARQIDLGHAALA